MFERIRHWLTVRRIIILAAGTFGALVVIGIGTYEFIAATESSVFCGEVCHTPMYPEYTTYQASPHSIVPCSDCHVGAGSYNLVTSKARGIPQIFQTVTGAYNRPIPSPVDNLRPARETCEKCHTPSKFTGFLVRTDTHFKPDEANTMETDTIVLKVGGGTSGVASGIHWHTAGKVWYLPMDEQRLEIGWVGVENDGVLTEYVNAVYADNITREMIDNGKRLMDCVDCHNRATHIFSSPDTLIDRAMTEGRINPSIPYIKKEAMDAIGSPQPSLETARARIEALDAYYQENYADFYAANQGVIEDALSELETIAKLTTFPEMRVDWNTHADNSGHNRPPDVLMAGVNVGFDNWRTNKSEGCFRCHGTLVSADGFAGTHGSTIAAASPKTLSADCNLCHYSLTTQQGSPVPKPLPHPTAGLENCLLCHGTSGLKPFPADHPWTNNEACTYCHQPPQDTVNIAVPVPAPVPAKNIPHTSKGLEDCLVCHGPGAPKAFNSGHPWSTNETCSACHQPAADILAQPIGARPPVTIPDIPHGTGGLEDCLVCHGPTSLRPFQADHPWATKDTCFACHRLAPDLLPLPDTTPIAGIPDIPHSTRGLEDCLVCHGPNLPRSFGTAHPWATNETCSACHAPAETTIPVRPSQNLAPNIPHSTGGLEDCRVCHYTSGPAPAPPSSHASIPTSFCTLCHRPF